MGLWIGFRIGNGHERTRTVPPTMAPERFGSAAGVLRGPR